LLFRLAWLRRFADPERGLGSLAEALPLAVGAGDRAAQACATFGRGFLLCRRGEIRAGLAEMARGLAALDVAWADGERLDDRGGAGQLLDPREARGALAHWLALVGRYGEARTLADALLAGEGDDRAAPLSARADARYALAEACLVAGQPGEARDAYERASEAYRALAHPVYSGGTVADLLRWVALPFGADRPAECARLAGEVTRAWAEAGDIYPLLLPRMLIGPLAGDWDEAREVALAASATSPGSVFRSAARIVLAALARERGDPAAAWAIVREVFPEGPQSEPGGTYYLPALALARLAVALALDAGDLPGARSWLAANDRWLAWGGVTFGAAESALLHAKCARAAGDKGAARDHARHALARAADPRQPLALLAVHRLIGALDAVDGRQADAATHLDAALALADACAAPYERALTLLAGAEARLRAGHHGAARAALVEAEAICAPLGATRALALAAALNARLDRARALPRRAHSARGRGAAAGDGGADQRRGCQSPLRQPAHGGSPPARDLRQARRHLAHRRRPPLRRPPARRVTPTGNSAHPRLPVPPHGRFSPPAPADLPAKCPRQVRRFARCATAVRGLE
jgi:hypothetical protein